MSAAPSALQVAALLARYYSATPKHSGGTGSSRRREHHHHHRRKKVRKTAEQEVKQVCRPNQLSLFSNKGRESSSSSSSKYYSSGNYSGSTASTASSSASSAPFYLHRPSSSSAAPSEISDADSGLSSSLGGGREFSLLVPPTSPLRSQGQAGEEPPPPPLRRCDSVPVYSTYELNRKPPSSRTASAASARAAISFYLHNGKCVSGNNEDNEGEGEDSASRRRVFFHTVGGGTSRVFGRPKLRVNISSHKSNGATNNKEKRDNSPGETINNK